MKIFKAIIGVLVWFGWLTFAFIYPRSLSEVDLPIRIYLAIVAALSMLLAILTVIEVLKYK